jgi:hypothetical protein
MRPIRGDLDRAALTMPKIARKKTSVMRLPRDIARQLLARDGSPIARVANRALQPGITAPWAMCRSA